MQPAAQFVALTLSTCALLTLGVAAFNAWVDPFMQYRKPGERRQFITGFARQVNAGLARNLDYNAAVVGSSYAMNFRNSDFDRAFQVRTASFAMPGMFVVEGTKMVSHAARQRRLDVVVFGLDSFAFIESNRTYAFPDYLYDSTWLNDWPYLLSLDTLKRSSYTRFGLGPRNYNVDLDTPWTWARDDVQPGREKVLTDYRKRYAAARKSTAAHQAEMERVAMTELGRMLAEHPKTRFELFLPPYSALTWALLDDEELERALHFRSFLAQIVDRYPNARLHDFQAHTEIICDLDLYVDIGHYGPAVNKMLVTLMAAKEFTATQRTLTRTNEALRNAAQTRCNGTLPIE